ncbi:hypothetical protein [Pseudomonas sp. GL-B-26]|uniref:hypothetical protein n=1 Tax=Pseudomonas sp. GL-B-26 TaxID=2832394 RepID=UPI001CBB7FAB|nr:hypothetical protein [Pseudomonas sp. GL-B-26]
MAISNEHGLTARTKEKFFSGLAIASSLVTLCGAPATFGVPVFNHIDLGALLMAITAAFGWGGAALGAYDFPNCEGFDE